VNLKKEITALPATYLHTHTRHLTTVISAVPPIFISLFLLKIYTETHEVKDFILFKYSLWLAIN